MAKTKIVKEKIQEEELVNKTAVHQEPLFIPDIPAQAEEVEKPQEIIANLNKENMYDPKPEIKEDSKEVKLLKKILHIQHSGGWGRHLDDIINERLKELEHEQ